MSRWVSLNQARAKASAKACGLSRKRREIFSNAGSKRSVRSVVSIVGLCFLPGMCASGMISGAFLATHCLAPAGDLTISHSYLNRCSKKSLLQRAGVVVQVTSRPLETVSLPWPLPKLLFQPRPCASSGAPSGSGPLCDSGAAPCALPKVWPPAISATISSSSIAMRPKVARMSLAAATGSPLAFGPSGFT